MLRLLVIFISFFLLSSSPLVAQSKSADYYKSVIRKNKRDTAEVNALNELSKQVRRTDPELGKKYVDKALNLAKKIDYKEGQGMAYRVFGMYYTSQGEYDKAVEALKKGETIFRKVDNKLGVVSCLNGLANVRMNQTDYVSATNYYFKTVSLNEEANHPSGVGKAYHNLGKVHYLQGSQDKAIEYFKASLDIKKTLGDSSGMMVSLNGLAAVLMDQESYLEALEAQNEALFIANKTNNLHEKANILNNIGVQFYYMEKYDSTRYYYLKSLRIHERLGELLEQAASLGNLGNLEYHLGNGKEAITYYDSSLVIAQSIGNKLYRAYSYEGLAVSNELIGNHKEAYNWFVKFHELNDSISGEKVKNNINELQVKYDTGKKDLKIAELEKSRLEESVKQEQEKQLVIMAVASILVIMIFLFFRLRQKNLREREKANALEQKVFRAQMNPHFIFNSLNSIQRMYVEGNEDQANDYMADFSRLLRSILENSGKNRITLKEELELTSNYLELEELRTRNLFDFEIELDEDIDPLLTKVPPLIFQPYIENAIWHGIMPKNAKGHIQLNIQGNNGHLVCEIVDDGVGFDTDNQQNQQNGKTSQGMAITAERLGGEQNVKLETAKGRGTSVTIKMEV